uniref:Uncharacterized protein n=1 Tax=Romanomermis culicivorax TaxID=13658 RepID=A0A915JHR3_ROMCU
MGHFRIILFVTLLHVERPLSQVTSPYETRPRLLIHEGNMHFQSGRDRNITFSTDGRSSIFFGSLDLKTLPSLGTISLYQQQLTSIEASSSSVREILTRTAGSLMRHDNSLRSLLSQNMLQKSNSSDQSHMSRSTNLINSYGI